MSNVTAGNVDSDLPGVNALPVCYTSLTPLVPQRHGSLRFARAQGYAFARGVNAVPALAEEFANAQNTCPIVFTRAEQPRPVLLMGMTSGKNDHVGPDGAWPPGQHVPGFLRRHPFMLVREKSASSRMILCADLSADGFSETEGQPLFEDGEPTEVIKRVLDYCERYEQATLRTDALVAELVALDLFQDASVSIRTENATRKIEGFRTVSEERFKSLDDAKLADLARRGIIGLLAAHWASIQQFQDIVPGADKP